jgi:hypothetical protein
LNTSVMKKLTFKDFDSIASNMIVYFTSTTMITIMTTPIKRLIFFELKSLFFFSLFTALDLLFFPPAF